VAKCLVFGGNGFLGSHLVDMLVGSGHDVSVFDRFSGGVPKFSATNVTKIVGDFLDNSQVAEAISGQEYVFHFLSFTTPVTAQGDPTLDIRTNLTQTVKMLELAAAAGICRMFFASTGGAIYGSRDQNSFSEIDQTWPVSPYAIVKLSIENYLRYFKVTHGLDYLVFRISNPYGSRQKTNTQQGLIPVALHRVHGGLPITRFGEGTMVRDYIYVDDVMKMIKITMDGERHHDTYNIGRGEGQSVNEILEAVGRVTKLNVNVREVPTPTTFVQRSVLDMARFRTDFGEFSYTPLHEGILKTWQAMTLPHADPVAGIPTA
jgi:UDP-glucose 4-epimerase